MKKYVVYVNVGNMTTTKTQEYLDSQKSIYSRLFQDDELWIIIAVRNEEQTRIVCINS